MRQSLANLSAFTKINLASRFHLGIKNGLKSLQKIERAIFGYVYFIVVPDSKA
jgi:hypothetical protein